MSMMDTSLQKYKDDENLILEILQDNHFLRNKVEELEAEITRLRGEGCDRIKELEAEISSLKKEKYDEEESKRRKIATPYSSNKWDILIPKVNKLFLKEIKDRKWKCIFIDYRTEKRCEKDVYNRGLFCGTHDYTVNKEHPYSFFRNAYDTMFVAQK